MTLDLRLVEAHHRIVEMPISSFKCEKSMFQREPGAPDLRRRMISETEDDLRRGLGERRRCSHHSTNCRKPNRTCKDSLRGRNNAHLDQGRSGGHDKESRE